MKKSTTFRPQETFAENVIRIALFLNEETGRQLSYRSNLHESIHNARLSVKRMRALLRLIRPAIGEDVFQHENAFYRDVAGQLSFLRDYSACLDAVKALEANRRSDFLKPRMNALAKRVYTLRHDVLAQTDTTKIFGEIREQLNTSLRRISQWNLTGDEGRIIDLGLHRLYGQGKRRFAKAMEDPGEVTFHEVRKNLKYLLYINQMLQALWPEVISAQLGEMKKLSDLLGTHHDIFILEHRFEEIIPPGASKLYRARLRQAIWREKKRLESQTLLKGSLIYADFPSAYAMKFRSWWLLVHPV